MSYMTAILPKLISFLVLIGVGYCASRFKVVKQEGLSTLSGLLIKIVLPCLTISLLRERGIGLVELLEYRRVIAGQVLTYLFMAAVGILCSRLLKLEPKKAGVHRGAMVGGNYAFIVIPMILALFPGGEGNPYVPVCSAVDTLVVWTLGLTLFTYGQGARFSILGLLRKMCNPIMASILLALIINTFDLNIPETVLSICDGIGSISYSLGLIYVGCNIYFLKKGANAMLLPALVLAFCKLLLVPFITYQVAIRFLPEVESVVLMLIAGAPSMTTSVSVADQYGLDQDYAASLVFLTTMGCMLSIPVLFLLISVV